MDIVKVTKRDNKLGIIMIKEKPLHDNNPDPMKNISYALNNILLETGETCMLFDSDFEKVGEIEDD